MAVTSPIKHWGNLIRNILLFKIRYPWVKTGTDIHCETSTIFWSPHRHIFLGNQVKIGYRCLFQSDTEVGNRVLIASDVAFLNSDDHRFDIVGKAIWDSGRGDQFKIVVEDDVRIGHRVLVLSPCRIGRGAIISAGSVVTRDVPPYAIVAGVPARLMKMRFSPEQILEHEAVLQKK